MKEVGASEARNRLGQLLDRVESGEEVAIMRRGKVVARLVPPEAPAPEAPDRARARAAVAQIRAMRKGVTRGEPSIRDRIDEGRA